MFTALVGILALAICVLSGCRSKLESNYSLINWPRSTLTLIWGDECAKATADIIPDVYKLGASGELTPRCPASASLTTPSPRRRMQGI